VRFGQWIGLVILTAALYILWEIRQLLLLVFGAVILANSLNLLAKRLQRLGLKRNLAVAIAISSLIAFMALFFGLVVPPFVQQFQEMLILVPKGIAELNSQLERTYASLPYLVKEYLPDLDTLGEQAMPFINRVLGGSFAIFSSSFGAGLNVLLITVLGIMMLVNPLAYRQGFVRLFPSFYRQRVHQILLECEVALGNWIVGALISMGVISLLSLVGLALIGVKAALANAVLAGLLNFIPNIGPTFSVIPPIAIALLDNPVKALAVLILYILIQQFESNVLTPIVMAQQVSLLPAVTLIAQVFFATFFGFWGLLLAIPLTVVCQIWVRRSIMEDILDRWENSPAIFSGKKTELETLTLPETEQLSSKIGDLEDGLAHPSEE